MATIVEKSSGLVGHRYPVDPITGKRLSAVPPSKFPQMIREALVSIGHMTTTELGLHIGTTRAVVAMHIRAMRRHNDPIFIHGWEFLPAGGRPSPVYILQPGGHDVKLYKKSRAEKRRKRYAENRARIRLLDSGSASKIFRLNNIFGLTAIQEVEHENQV